VLEPLRTGASEISVMASDGVTSVSRSFWYLVGEVTKVVEVQAPESPTTAISLRNAGEQPVDFAMVQNGFETFETIDDIVRHVWDMPAEFPGETFQRKLWRYVRDNVYHWPFLKPDTWLMNPVVQVNSVGFGFCSSVAAMYAAIARAAGYEARIWALSGHVVPEIRIGGNWEMYDPDLAVYYVGHDGSVLGVEALAANPSLITAPPARLFPVGEYDVPYSAAVAEIYGSEADNFVWALTAGEGLVSRIVLPPGATLTYQGRWTAAPVAYDDEGNQYEVTEYQQAALLLRENWTGVVPLPWVLWAVSGSGTVRIDGVEFAIDSDSLRERLHALGSPILELEVLEASGETQLVFLVNPLRHEVLPQNILELTGEHVWQIQVETQQLPPEVQPGPAFPDSLRKPVPVVVDASL